jgi:hypothetical protein
MKHIIEDFTPESGWHCITTSFKQVFHYYGYDLSEEMLFGLASGLNFFYLDFKSMPFPMIGGRTKIGEFEQALANNTGINIEMQQTTSIKKARKELLSLVEKDIPVPVYVDMAFLRYLGLPDNTHFGGHTIVVFGIDEENDLAYVSDRDGKEFQVSENPTEPPADYHCISLQDLEQARNSKYKPYPPKNKWVTFDFTEKKKIDREMIFKAIRENMENLLNPPIKNLGVKGIEIFSQRLKHWKSMENETFKWATINAYIMINAIGGNGGGIFRKMYGNFLKESAKTTEESSLSKLGERCKKIGKQWDEVGYEFKEMFERLDKRKLDHIPVLLRNIEKEEKHVYETLYGIVK